MGTIHTHLKEEKDEAQVTQWQAQVQRANKCYSWDFNSRYISIVPNCFLNYGPTSLALSIGLITWCISQFLPPYFTNFYMENKKICEHYDNWNFYRENGISLPLQIQYNPTKYKHASIAVITLKRGGGGNPEGLKPKSSIFLSEEPCLITGPVPRPAFLNK